MYVCFKSNSCIKIENPQVFIQLILLYSDFPFGTGTDTFLDLRNILFSSSILSKLHYFALLLSSGASVSISLGRILTFGGKPIVKSMLSTKFLNIVLFLLTKFLILAFMLAKVVKSMMMYYVYSGQNDAFFSVIKHNYRGLCKTETKLKHFSEYFCKSSHLLSFTDVTIYLPTIGLIFLYFPSIIYIIVLVSTRKHKKKLDFYYGFVFFIFSIVTNMSVFGDHPTTENAIQKDNAGSAEAQPRRFSLDVSPRPTLHSSKRKPSRSQSWSPGQRSTIQPSQRFASLPQLQPACLPFVHGQKSPDLSETEDIFSLHQSNVLYCLFLASAVIFVSFTTVFQVLRAQASDLATMLHVISVVNLAAACCLIINMALWLNFNWNLGQIKTQR